MFPGRSIRSYPPKSAQFSVGPSTKFRSVQQMLHQKLSHDTVLPFCAFLLTPISPAFHQNSRCIRFSESHFASQLDTQIAFTSRVPSKKAKAHFFALRLWFLLHPLFSLRQNGPYIGVHFVSKKQAPSRGRGSKATRRKKLFPGKICRFEGGVFCFRSPVCVGGGGEKGRKKNPSNPRTPGNVPGGPGVGRLSLIDTESLNCTAALKTLAHLLTSFREIECHRGHTRNICCSFRNPGQESAIPTSF